MKAYFVVYETVHDPEIRRSLAPEVRSSLEAHGGRFLVRAAPFTKVEGETPYQRIAVLEFPSRSDAEAWYYAPQYQHVVALRSQWADYQIVLVDGVEN